MPGHISWFVWGRGKDMNSAQMWGSNLSEELKWLEVSPDVTRLRERLWNLYEGVRTCRMAQLSK